MSLRTENKVNTAFNRGIVEGERNVIAFLSDNFSGNNSVAKPYFDFKATRVNVLQENSCKTIRIEK